MRVSVNADKADAKCHLVGVDGVVLVRADTAVPVAIVVVCELTEGDDASVISIGGTIQGRKLEASLRNANNLVRDTITIQAGSNTVGIVILSD